MLPAEDSFGTQPHLGPYQAPAVVEAHLAAADLDLVLAVVIVFGVPFPECAAVAVSVVAATSAEASAEHSAAEQGNPRVLRKVIAALEVQWWNHLRIVPLACVGFVLAVKSLAAFEVLAAVVSY